jgi:hypothetical protein
MNRTIISGALLHGTSNVGRTVSGVGCTYVDIGYILAGSSDSVSRWCCVSALQLYKHVLVPLQHDNGVYLINTVSLSSDAVSTTPSNIPGPHLVLGAGILFPIPKDVRFYVLKRYHLMMLNYGTAGRCSERIVAAARQNGLLYRHAQHHVALRM